MLDVAVRPRILRAPDPNPPYDAVDYVWQPEPQVSGQGVLPLDFRSSRTIAVARWVEASPAEPELYARMVARAIADAVTGTRTPAQLRPWLTRNVQRRVVVAARLAGGVRYTADAVHVGHLSPTVVEATATLHAHDHAHAMAFRLEARGRSWVCTAVEIGLLPRR